MEGKFAQHTDESRLQYVNNLRGIAILMVIVRHSRADYLNLNETVSLLAQFGQMGVQLFFVVSAFTLCLSVDRRSMQQEELITFYLRRYFRIAPLFYTGILLYLFYFSVLNPLLAGKPLGWDPNYTPLNIAANLLLIHDFFAGGAIGVVAGGWSIATEMKFYLLFPLLFWLYNKFRNNGIFLLLMPVAGLILSICTFVALEFVATSYFNYKNFDLLAQKNEILYFNIICQLPVFLLGLSLYFFHKKFPQFYNRQRAMVVVMAILSTAIAIWVYGSAMKPISLLPFAAGFSFVWLFLIFREFPGLTSRLLGKIGELSYSIYLFHFIFAWQGIKFWHKYLHDYTSDDVILILTIISTFLFTLPLAILTEKYIERPGIRLGKRIISHYRQRSRRNSFLFAQEEAKSVG